MVLPRQQEIFFMLVNEIKTSKIIWNQSQSVILKSIL